MKNRRIDIDTVLSARSFAVIGVSRDEKQFANGIYRELRSRKVTVYPVNPHAAMVEGDRCYPDLSSLPSPVEAALVFLPRPKVLEVLPEALRCGIRKVWLQQGTESPAAVEFCATNGITVVAGECVWMFLAPVAGFHRFHGWVRSVTGRLPR